MIWLRRAVTHVSSSRWASVAVGPGRDAAAMIWPSRTARSACTGVGLRHAGSAVSATTTLSDLPL
jgi:hypothetical protein